MKFRTVRFEMNVEDKRFLLAMLERARGVADMPFQQQAIDRIVDAIRAQPQPTCNVNRPWEAPSV